MTNNDKLDELIFQLLGEASALFMHSPIPGNQQIMPTEHLKKLGDKTKIKLEAYLADREREARIKEITLVCEKRKWSKTGTTGEYLEKRLAQLTSADKGKHE